MLIISWRLRVNRPVDGSLQDPLTEDILQHMAFTKNLALEAD